MLLDSFLKELLYWPSKMTEGARIGLHMEGRSLRNDIEAHSPVDTGKYKRSWRTKVSHKDVSIVIFNNDSKGLAMEEGLDINEAPWYYPGARRKTGRLVVKYGRVWAGGHNPGHAKSAGGALNNVLLSKSRRQVQLARVIADNIIKGLK